MNSIKSTSSLSKNLNKVYGHAVTSYLQSIIQNNDQKTTFSVEIHHSFFVKKFFIEKYKVTQQHRLKPRSGVRRWERIVHIGCGLRQCPTGV